MTNIQDIIQSSVRRSSSSQAITYSPAQMRSISGGLGHVKTVPKGTSYMQKADPRITQLIQASVKRAPSVQPSAPTIATSSTTARALNAPVAPTAIGRLSSVTKISPLSSSYARTFKLLPESSQMAQLIRASVKTAPSAHPIMPAGASGFTPIPSALAAPLGGGGALATPSSPGGLGGIASGIVDTVKSYIPLATKIVLAVIAIKILLWLIRGKRR